MLRPVILFLHSFFLVAVLVALAAVGYGVWLAWDIWGGLVAAGSALAGLSIVAVVFGGLALQLENNALLRRIAENSGRAGRLPANGTARGEPAMHRAQSDEVAQVPAVSTLIARR